MIFVREIAPTSDDIEVIAPTDAHASFIRHLGALTRGIEPDVDMPIEAIVEMIEDLDAAKTLIRHAKPLFALDVASQAATMIGAAYEQGAITEYDRMGHSRWLHLYTARQDYSFVDQRGLDTNEHFDVATYELDELLPTDSEQYAIAKSIGAKTGAIQYEVTPNAYSFDTSYNPLINISCGIGEATAYWPIATLLSPLRLP